jgi:hypothetical protein
MGEWKAPLSLRVREQLRRELEAFAAKEHRTLGNLGELLIEWAAERLRECGSTEALLAKYKKPSKNNSKEPRVGN